MYDAVFLNYIDTKVESNTIKIFVISLCLHVFVIQNRVMISSIIHLNTPQTFLDLFMCNFVDNFQNEDIFYSVFVYPSLAKSSIYGRR